MQGLCDKTIWRAGRPEKACRRKAKWQRKASSGCWLEFCDRHAETAHNPNISEFKPAPFSEVEPIR